MNEIAVKTSFGTLVAQLGSDSEYPEILVFLRNDNGQELMLSAVTDQSVSGLEDTLRIAVYGDTRMDDYNKKITLRRDDINAPNAMWQ